MQGTWNTTVNMQLVTLQVDQMEDVDVVIWEMCMVVR